MGSFGGWLSAICGTGAIVSLTLALRSGRRRLLIDYLPTSKTTSVFVGHVELKGTAESDRPLRSQFTNSPCVWFRVTLQERSPNSNDEKDWQTRFVTQEVPFQLKDDRGTIRIDPQGATIKPEVVYDRNRSDRQNKSPIRAFIPDNVRLVREEIIRLHSRIFVVGHAQQRRDMAAAEIAAHKDEAMFLISTQREDVVSRSLRLWSWGWGFIGLGLLLFGLDVREDVLYDRHPAFTAFIKTTLFYFALWLAGWVVMMINSLIDLRQRVRKAWASIDVELKRRADLLPKLANMVNAMHLHEQKVQQLIATLRAQGSATAPGHSGPDPMAVSAPLKIIAEAYPQLKAQGLFASLQKQLAETEDRIALARNFFNDTATFYNTRLAIFPDGLLAGLMAMKTQPLMNEAGFVRAPTVMKTPGSDTAGPCPQCRHDVRSRAGLKFCPFCGSDQLVPADGDMPGSCRACGGYQKPVSASDGRLLGNVLYCGACRFQLVR